MRDFENMPLWEYAIRAFAAVILIPISIAAGILFFFINRQWKDEI